MNNYFSAFAAMLSISTATFALDTSGDPPAVACRYESFQDSNKTARHAATSSYLWRDINHVETRDASGQTGTLWERSGEGEIVFRKLYHSARKAIEYYADDLRATGNAPDWKAIVSMFDPGLLGTTLKSVGHEIYLNRVAERFRGNINGVTVEVLWLTRERLPALVIKSAAQQRQTLRLAEIWPLKNAPKRSSSRAQLDQYQHLDFADLGDMESDPFVLWATAENHTHQH